MESETIAADVRSRRLAAGRSQLDLAERAWCSWSTIRLFERGYLPASSNALARVLAALDATEGAPVSSVPAGPTRAPAMARPSKLAPAVGEKIAMAIAGCSSYRAAAMYAGVADSTLRSWLARGRAEQLVTRPHGARHAKRADREAPYVELLQRVDRAAAHAEVRAAALIAKAGESDWRAAAWFLERRDPDTFGRRLALEPAGAAGGAIEISTLDRLDLSKLSEAELKTLQKIVGNAEQ